MMTINPHEGEVIGLLFVSELIRTGHLKSRTNVLLKAYPLKGI